MARLHELTTVELERPLNLVERLDPLQRLRTAEVGIEAVQVGVDATGLEPVLLRGHHNELRCGIAGRVSQRPSEVVCGAVQQLDRPLGVVVRPEGLEHDLPSDAPASASDQ